MTAQTVNAVETTTEKATAATRAAGEKTAATARAAQAPPTSLTQGLTDSVD